MKWLPAEPIATVADIKRALDELRSATARGESVRAQDLEEQLLRGVMASVAVGRAGPEEATFLMLSLAAVAVPTDAHSQKRRAT